MLQIKQINIFPIKSLGAIRPDSATLSDRGLTLDRRRMLVDPTGRFVTQRQQPIMSQLAVELEGDSLRITDRRGGCEHLVVPLECTGATCDVTVFNDTCHAHVYSDDINDWFSDRLGIPVRLVYMPDDADRPIDPDYSINDEQVSFADNYQVLIIGEASLTDLNSRLAEPVSMDRFRPNLVFTGGDAFAEDRWKCIRVGDVEFHAVKLCPRCVLTTVDPETSKMGREPLKTLASYRTFDGGAMFGQNLLHGNKGTIRVGDRIELVESASE